MVFEENKEYILKGEDRHGYDISLKSGDFLQLYLEQKKINIQILALSPKKDTIQGFNAINTKDGLEIVELLIKYNGTHRFEVSPVIFNTLKDSVRQNFIKNIDGSYLVKKIKILSSKEHKALIKYRKTQQDSVITWIKKDAIPLKGVKSETGLEDLAYLKPILKDVQVVGMGETSHGTREIFQMKHRMLEFLVKEMEFTLFGIEASSVGCRPINDYVLYGKGNSRDALSGQGFWIWNVESVIDMIEWMYEYNKTVPMSKKVKFIGVDTQTYGLEPAYQNISSFLEKTKDHCLIEVNIDSLFENIRTITDWQDLSNTRQKLYNVLSHLVINKMSLINKSSKQKYISALTDLKKIIQGVEAGDRKLEKNAGYNIRDEYMAQTVLEALEKEGAEAKMMIWAHNGHINKNPDSYTNGSQQPLGSVLKRYLGDKKYYAVGFSTYQGSFQARNYMIKKKKYSGVGSFKIYPATEGSLDWYFLKSKKDIIFMDFTDYPNHNSIHTFLDKELVMHTASANWTYEYSFSPTTKIVPSKFYDGMIFIKETSSSTLTPGGEKEIAKRIAEGR